jgi:hypothetical protein
MLPAEHVRELSPQINVELVAGQEVFGQRSGVKGPLNATERDTGKGGEGQNTMCAEHALVCDEGRGCLQMQCNFLFP